MPPHYCMPHGPKPDFLNPKELLELRTLESDLEGHPTPRLSFVDMATGSLGQGLSVGIGIASIINIWIKRLLEPMWY